ncbi:MULTISPECIES: TMEM175 family protein [Streptacidiphilus]|uniref:TMEM175 family protein n=1 Tax=Streptacidiphilus cavernicola TaxID=3342716 RepID=A0ABV6USU9_9ACTN|nr:TMEM175 family protein [Streptacidiphilus jeojiense]
MTEAVDREPPDDALEARAVAAERLTFFSDAVIAIALTLLALELPLPEGSTNSALLHAAFKDREGYLAFVISFLVIGSHWRSHHTLFRYVTGLNRRLTNLTLYWLLILVITPFATRLLSSDGAFQARFSFYAAVQCAGCVLFVLMLREVRRDGLLREGTPPELFPRTVQRITVMAVAFLVSIPVSFAAGQYAYLCWILAPAAGRAVHDWSLHDRPLQHRLRR